MEPTSQHKAQGGGESGDKAQTEDTLSPKLVREIADKVYALLLQDLRMERERYRAAAKFKNR